MFDKANETFCCANCMAGFLVAMAPSGNRRGGYSKQNRVVVTAVFLSLKTAAHGESRIKEKAHDNINQSIMSVSPVRYWMT